MTKLQKIFTNIRHDTCTTLKKKKHDYMKMKVNNLKKNNKNKNIWEMYKGTNEFKKDYQPQRYVIKEDDGTIYSS